MEQIRNTRMHLIRRGTGERREGERRKTTRGELKRNRTGNRTAREGKKSGWKTRIELCRREKGKGKKEEEEETNRE